MTGVSRSSFCMHDTRSDLRCAGVGLGIAPRLFAKVTEGVSGQSFNSGHGIHAPHIRSVSNSSELW